MEENSERKEDEIKDEKKIDFTTSRAGSIPTRCLKCGHVFISDDDRNNHTC